MRSRLGCDTVHSSLAQRHEEVIPAAPEVRLVGRRRRCCVAWAVMARWCRGAARRRTRCWGLLLALGWTDELAVGATEQLRTPRFVVLSATSPSMHLRRAA
jgi:hypothetical protein